ncbi:MAG: glycosyl hydrolase family 28-related protein [Pseudomonadota bacterium]
MTGKLIAAIALLCAIACPALAGPSVYLTKPDDPRAVTVQAKGDGRSDDSVAIQRAIDAAAGEGQGGIVFLPSGRYRLTRTILVWPAVRIFGVGPTRPVFVLGASTPGFQKGVATMFIFTGGDQYNVGQVPVPPPTSVPFSDRVRDANSATFYSAMSNVDFEIGAGNPAAAGVRFRVAQHGFLSHIDFRTGSGFAGIYQAGNVGRDLRFFGGRYGIVTEKTSPAWQFTLLDSTFEGQRDAAIREHEAQLTLANVSIRNTRVGIDIDRGYSDELWGRDVRFENVSHAAVVISNEASPLTQIGFENAVIRNVPVFARYRDSGTSLAGSRRASRFRSFNHGLAVPELGQMGKLASVSMAEDLPAMPPRGPSALRSLPPTAEWINVRTLGAKGDDETDDTAALQKAVETHRVLYFPIGRYRITDTLHLRRDTVLIGLHPSLTQIVLPDDTPAWRGVGDPKPLVESASGGEAMLFSLGLQTGAINPRATALLWRAGAGSQVDDVKIHGGAGTSFPPGKRIDFSDPRYRWDGQYPSIMVVDGGGGTFNSVWTANTFAQSGLYVANTRTPGTVYEMSAEHHVRNEIVLDGVENWTFLAPQTEQEVRDGQDTVAVEIRNSRNILLANYHGYRVTRSIKPAPAAIRLYNSDDIHLRNVHVNAESGYAFCDGGGCGTYLRASKFPFENSVQDMTRRLEVREREFAWLDISGDSTPAPASGKVEKLETGFYSISGAAVDGAGNLYFVERRFHRIYRWSKAHGLEIVRDAPLDPVNLAVDASGHLMVLSIDGPEATVYSFDPAKKDGSITLIPPTPAARRPGAAVALPANFWNNGEFRDQLDFETFEFTTLATLFARDMATPKPREYVSPDGSLVLPAFRTIQQGPPNHLGWRFSDTLDTYGFVTARPGERVHIVNSSEDAVYAGRVEHGGVVTDLEPLTNRGGESVAAGPDGRLYVANGQVWIYDAKGTEIGRIDVPERPIQLIFGGPDKRTLFILTHHSLYAAVL